MSLGFSFNVRSKIYVKWRNIMMSLFEIHAVVATPRVHEREFHFFHSFIAHYIYITYIIILYRFSRSRKLYPHNVTIINNELKSCSRMMMFHSFLLWRISYVCRIHLQTSYFNSIKLNLEFNKKIYSCHCRCAYLLKSKWVGVSFLVLLFDFVSVASEIFLFFLWSRYGNKLLWVFLTTIKQTWSIHRCTVKLYLSLSVKTSVVKFKG